MTVVWHFHEDCWGRSLDNVKCSFCHNRIVSAPFIIWDLGPEQHIAICNKCCSRLLTPLLRDFMEITKPSYFNRSQNGSILQHRSFKQTVRKHEVLTQWWEERAEFEVGQNIGRDEIQDDFNSWIMENKTYLQSKNERLDEPDQYDLGQFLLSVGGESSILGWSNIRLRRHAMTENKDAEPRRVRIKEDERGAYLPANPSTCLYRGEVSCISGSGSSVCGSYMGEEKSSIGLIYVFCQSPASDD